MYSTPDIFISAGDVGSILISIFSISNMENIEDSQKEYVLLADFNVSDALPLSKIIGFF